MKENADHPKFETWKPKEGGRYCFICTDGAVSTEVWEGCDWLCQHRYNSGNCFPPRRQIAITQAEINSITQRLNQACILFGGTLYARAGNSFRNFPASINLKPDEPLGEWVAVGSWYFPIALRNRFNEEFNADLTRLAELNATLTKEWSELPLLYGITRQHEEANKA